MFRGPFVLLGALLVSIIVMPILLPLAVLLGYPLLLIIGGVIFARWLAGHQERPGEMAAVWAAYLGLIVTLHGIILAADTALAGAPPTPAEKRFGTNLAYLGASVAAASVVAAYGLDVRGRRAGGKPGKPGPLDDGPGL